jgi:hypothetical protein
MKLLHCANCEDVFSLRPAFENEAVQIGSCSCGKTKGLFVDAFKAVYSGPNCQPIIIRNESLYSSLHRKQEKGRSTDLTAYVPDDRQAHFRKISEADFDSIVQTINSNKNEVTYHQR